MTGQDLLDRMELLNSELQLQSGEANVAKGLLALNVSQDYFESLAAGRSKIFGSSSGTVTASNGIEATSYPAGLLRIDRLQVLDDSTGRPKSELEPLRRAGGHAYNTYWPLNVITGTGQPRKYWTNGISIYWSPLPDTDYTVRYYGFRTAPAITAQGTFAYPDIVALSLASFAGRLYKSGLDDDAKDLASLALETFTPVLNTLGNFNRDGAVGLEYTQIHTE